MAKDNKESNVILDSVKQTAADAALVIGKEAGGIAVQAAIKSGALAVAASKVSLNTMTKVAGYGATSEARAEIKDLNKQIKVLNKTIEDQNNLIEQLKLEIENLKKV